MLKQVSFMSLQRMQALEASKHAIVVSVTDSSPHSVRPQLDGYRDVLRLEFIDITEEHVGAEPGAWPLEPTPLQHEQLTELWGERMPALSDAVAIRTFLDAHHAGIESIEVLVHCFAGASRSAAIAMWAAAYYGVPLVDLSGRGTGEANERLLRLLKLADAG